MEKNQVARPGCLVLETGEIFPGYLLCGAPQAGEVVFNTSHSGYEEIATDPSYFSQILVMTAPMQGNYGADDGVWESDKIWIKGFVSLEIQSDAGERSWREKLAASHVPLLTQVDTRKLVLRLREKGVVWGALVGLSENSLSFGRDLIRETKKQPKDWTYIVSEKAPKIFKGEKKKGPEIALIDFGYKKNILRELLKKSSFVKLFPCHSTPEEVKKWNPDGIVLSNGPGDPKDVTSGALLVGSLIGSRPIFGICMGHQVLGLAAGGKTHKLKFGHRGGNHPIKDQMLNCIYMAAHNHGYAVSEDSLPPDVKVSHKNLNDGSVAGIYSEERNFFGVQFHPESHPGPHESTALFDVFFKKVEDYKKKANSDSSKEHSVKTPLKNSKKNSSKKSDSVKESSHAS